MSIEEAADLEIQEMHEKEANDNGNGTSSDENHLTGYFSDCGEHN